MYCRPLKHRYLTIVFICIALYVSHIQSDRVDYLPRSYCQVRRTTDNTVVLQVDRLTNLHYHSMEKKMKALFISAAVAAALLTSAASFAQAPAAAPAGSTGLCKDGSYSSNATKKGACAGHKGVKTWYAPAAAAAAAPATTPAAAPATTPAAAPAAAPAAMAKPAAPAAMAPAKPAAAAAAPAAGANPGDVWVNSSSKVYHCAGSKYYGKTKAGSYMTEAAAKAAGNHADHGKACS